MIFLNEIEIERAVKFLKNNEVTILPTDTIYGLSAIVNENNKMKINEIKKRELDKHLIILVSTLDQASEFIEVNDTVIKYLCAKKPITVIGNNRKSDTCHGVRLVKRDDIKKIIDKTGPIYSSSVNYYGFKHLSKKNHLISFLDDERKVFYTDKLKGKPSKILNLSDVSKKNWYR